MVGREHEELFSYINWHQQTPWDVLEETLQRAWLLHCQYKILTKNWFTTWWK